MAYFDYSQFLREKEETEAAIRKAQQIPPDKKFTLSFRDAYTGRSLTDAFPAGMYLTDIVRRMEEEQILSFPAYYSDVKVRVAVPEMQFLPKVQNIFDLHTGMTIPVEIESTRISHLGQNPNIRKAYPLTFYLMQRNVCTKRIDFTGYGFENDGMLLYRMQISGLFWDSHGDGNVFDNRMLYWPTEAGMSTVEHTDHTQSKYLYEFDPKPGRVFIIKEEFQPIALPSHG